MVKTRLRDEAYSVPSFYPQRYTVVISIFETKRFSDMIFNQASVPDQAFPEGDPADGSEDASKS